MQDQIREHKANNPTAWTKFVMHVPNGSAELPFSVCNRIPILNYFKQNGYSAIGIDN